VKAVFADAYYFFALLNARDEAHESVTRFNSTLRSPIVTSAWVLTEVGDGLAGTSSRSMFSKLLDQLRSDSRVTIVAPTEKFFDVGVALYDKRKDKAWSLTDCISFEIMREHGIRDALTADKHFEQAGFNAMLKADS
jgi:uncharacterized protein